MDGYRRCAGKFGMLVVRSRANIESPEDRFPGARREWLKRGVGCTFQNKKLKQRILAPVSKLSEGYFSRLVDKVLMQIKFAQLVSRKKSYTHG
jgi:hypothetical protein